MIAHCEFRGHRIARIDRFGDTVMLIKDRPAVGVASPALPSNGAGLAHQIGERRNQQGKNGIARRPSDRSVKRNIMFDLSLQVIASTPHRPGMIEYCRRVRRAAPHRGEFGRPALEVSDERPTPAAL